MEDILGNYSTVVETLIQAMQYVHRKSHSVHLASYRGGVCINAGKQGMRQNVPLCAKKPGLIIRRDT